ncbi:MAG: hypothetical protein RQ741_09835 [Wenzhouxiangellaceae bacterium]|nr:hypothetical protein [Wenzhouxiangellaceae bacterium]
MNLYSAIVAIVAIWAVAAITRHWLAAQRESSAAGRGAQSQEMEQLENRIRTLERLVVDDRESLKRKFEDL